MAYLGSIGRRSGSLWRWCQLGHANAAWSLSSANITAPGLMASPASETSAAQPAMHSWATHRAQSPSGGIGLFWQPHFGAGSCQRGISSSAAPASKDYYRILGVSKNATEAEIKKAWYTLAKKYHPDSSKDAGAKEKYHDAQKAYQTLSNAEQRSIYDQVGADNFEQMESGGGHPGGGHPGGGHPGGGFSGGGRSSSWGFQDTEGSFSFGSQGGNFDFHDLFAQAMRQQQQQQAVRQMNVRVNLSFVEAAKGTSKILHISKHLPSPQQVDVQIPGGVEHGMMLSVGEVLSGGKGRPAVELIVNLAVEKHPIFERHAEHILVHTTVDMVDACLGTDIIVPTIDGDKTVIIRAGAQNGDRLRLKGLGAFVFGSRARGDQYIIIRVAIPRALTMRQRELLEEFSAVGEDAASTAT